MRKGCSAAFLFLSCLSFRRSHLPASSGRPGKALSSVSLLNNILPLTGGALEEKEKRGRYKSSAALSFFEYSEFYAGLFPGKSASAACSGPPFKSCCRAGHLTNFFLPDRTRAAPARDTVRRISHTPALDPSSVLAPRFALVVPDDPV